MDDTTLKPLLAGIAAVALIAAGLLFWNNRGLHDEITTLKAARASVEREAKAASERANVAERSMDEMKAEVSKVQAANETVNHSVTQLRSQLEQVQIQANTAQGEAARLKEDMGKERAARELAQKAAREADDRFQAELKRAQDDVAKERAAREAAELLARNAATSGSSTGTPPQSNP
jgi:chromosome segregation ATPase